jgi:hypothetical protein
MDAGLALVTRDGDGLALVVIVDRFGVLVVAETGEPSRGGAGGDRAGAGGVVRGVRRSGFPWCGGFAGALVQLVVIVVVVLVTVLVT